MKIQVKVHPQSKSQKIKKLEGNSYSIHLKKPALDNKANEELIKLLSTYFKAPIKIIMGKNSKNKIIEVIK